MKSWALLLHLALLPACERNWVQYGKEASLEEMQSNAISVSETVSLGSGEVTVEGRLGEVCELGCWFYLLDDAELIFVRRERGTGWAIEPGSSGLRAVARGALQGEGEGLELAARSVAVLE